MSSNIYVSTSGTDTHPGTRGKPLATLMQARAALRALSPEERAGSTIWLCGGDYIMSETLQLTSQDSGLAGAPVTLRAVPDETVRLLGGRVVTGFAPVGDSAVLARLDPRAQGNVMQLDLRKLGVEGLSRMRSRGFSRPLLPAHVELFFNGQPMTLARWPNTGAPEPFVHIAGFPEGKGSDDGHGTQLGQLAAGFTYEGDRPQRWAPDDDVWVHGYWAYDWANSYERIAAIDKDLRHIRTHKPHGLYSIRPGQRIYFLNVLEELDEPGEFYVDRRRGMLYFWPPDPLAAAEVILSLLEKPMLSLRRARHVVIRDLTLNATRGHGISITGGSSCLVADCTISNTGNYGVWVDGGVDHGVQGCHIFNNGDGGVSLQGGNRNKLEPCHHYVHNCHLHHQARWSRCYVPAVIMSGVGTRVSNNLIHDHPHCPILFTGNGHIIEYNDIHHVCQETGDVGAIYTGRDWTYRDNVIRFNHLHDIHGPGMLGSIAVYLDDCVSGVTVFGNIFQGTQMAAFIGGGRDCSIENNLFIDTHPAVQIDGRGLSPREVWQNMVNVTMKDRLLSLLHESLFEGLKGARGFASCCN
ncbi:MAG: right-handed parallel beta-helix repeat-containing protein, partial [bacterium]|nr:right-handed parallel beta-helix repeat-containing protein [bacterium]